MRPSTPATAAAHHQARRVHGRRQEENIGKDGWLVTLKVYPDYSVWRQVVTDQMDVLQCSMVGRYIYFASQQQRVFVNVRWTADDQTDSRDHHFYAAHRSHTPCLFNQMVNRETVRDQWPLLLATLAHIALDNHPCCDQNDSSDAKRLRLAAS